MPPTRRSRLAWSSSLFSFGEVRELQPQLLERAQPAALPLDVGGESGDLAFQVPAGLARPRGADLRRLSLGLGANLPIGGLLTAKPLRR